MQDRRLDLEVAVVVEEPSQFTNDQTALHKHIPDIGIYNQVDVSASVADFDIRESVPFLREWKETLGEKREFTGQNRQFTGARAKERPLDANEVTDVEQLIQLEVTFGNLILLGINLNFRTGIGQGEKPRLTERPIGQNSAGYTNLYRVMFEFFRRFAGIGVDDFRNRVGVSVFG